jgi:hypothetical protein
LTTIEELQNVREMIQPYIEGSNGDATKLQHAFHPDTRMVGRIRDEDGNSPIGGFIDWVVENPGLASPTTGPDSFDRSNGRRWRGHIGGEGLFWLRLCRLLLGGALEGCVANRQQDLSGHTRNTAYPLSLFFGPGVGGPTSQKSNPTLAIVRISKLVKESQLPQPPIGKPSN